MLGFFLPASRRSSPGYISFVSGVSPWDMQLVECREHIGRVFLATVVFVFGFAVIFTAFGASASFIGAFVIDNRLLFSRVGGVIVILLGLTMLG